ncbi:hypothetical protein ACFONC_10250 [Luteimonas soli]|uniref:Lipoprotein n=1 Tax=Luteimonas soli TaxID=1648966 RepID=A0ABV7XK37_9GAMM
MNHRHILCAIVLAAGTAVVSGCGDREAAEAARAAAQAAADEKAAKEYADGFEAAVAEENWALAKAHGDVLFARFPDTEQAARVRPHYDEVKAKAGAEREHARMAALWSYQSEDVKGGKQLSAAVYSKDAVDTDGSGANPVRLIFRDHPDWGTSSYLVLQAGDFDCYGGCRVKVKVDDAEPKSMSALRPDTDEATAMFINDEHGLWRMFEGATQVSIEFPVKAGGTRTAVFEVAGLDRTKLPGWD